MLTSAQGSTTLVFGTASVSRELDILDEEIAIAFAIFLCRVPQNESYQVQLNKACYASEGMHIFSR